MSTGRTHAPRLILALAILLQGCSSGPDYRRPAVDVPAAFKESGPAGWKAAAPADALPRDGWWARYRDPALDALIARLGDDQPAIALAGARYREALGQAGAARAALWPSLSAGWSDSLGRNAADGTSRSRRLGLEAAWEADLWGRLRRQAEAGEEGGRAAAADLAAVRLSVQASLAQAYFLLRVQDARQELLDATVAAYGRAVELTRNRLAVGIATPADVAQAQTQLHSTRALAADNRVARAQLEHLLATLLGRPPADFALPPDPLRPADFSPPPVPAGLPSELLERRPDVAAAERRVAAANAEIGVARAAWFPSLTLSASRGQSAAHYGALLDTPARVWSLGAALALTLFDGGERRALEAAAQARYDASAAGYRQAVLDAFREVEDALAALGGLEEEAEAVAAAVRSARESEQQTLNRYKAGMVDYLSVVTVQATTLGNERQALDVFGRRLAASVDLVRALGGGWPGDDALRLADGE
ncbi:efflux transporter outer membrane subunit [Thauera sinica]|uniref:Efflux transporter outer membrane subunit n=1 Tax=Thauera sinica TaxID=2665146 RepID=A0ABW1AMV9_9RHOO|nr:efflux transporter outer membrane subunit [Thauera sp. K11]ATE59166.1 RND transporter [Thauera sp. K11]